MTDPEENTGSVTLKGGSWYPVQLAESGSGEQSFDPGDTVFENEWVTIGLRSVESEWQDVDEFYDEAYGRWEWNLSFVNRSGDNLEIRFTDETVNGETLPEFGTDTYLILEDSEIGAGAKKYTALSFRTTEKMEQPEVAFRVQVRTQGGGKLLDYSDEITISPQ